MNEPGLDYRDNRSLTPCLDENGVDEICDLESSKEIELSDISDIEDENWQISDERRDATKANGNGSKASDLTFKKINRSTRGRNYRDNIRRNPEVAGHSGQQRSPHKPYRTFDNKRREIKRYNVRNIVASRDFSISRSRSISSRRRSRSLSPKRDVYRRKSISPARNRANRYKTPPRKYSPISSKHSRSPSLGHYRTYRRTPTPEKPTVARRSRSRHKPDKIRSTEKVSKRKKHKSKDHQRKQKKSRSKSKPRYSSSPSISPEPTRSVTSQSRQIMTVTNSSLPQENIKVILKNEEAIAKRQKLKKREKKIKKDKLLRKEIVEKTTKEPLPGKEVSKEVFASGDNILISVCFNNNNNNNGKPKEDQVIVERQLTPIKTKAKKRLASPASSISTTSFEESERRQKKHKRKKVKNKRDRVESKAPETPPIIMQSKRKSDMKPIAIIDLEKSPGKEITQSPREVIVLSDSDGDGKKRDAGSKDVIFIEDLVLDKNASRNQPPASPRNLTPPAPVLKFALKSKSNILPFNLLHDHAEEIEDQEAASANAANDSQKNSNSHQQEESNNMEVKNSNQRDAYDPFEPTKSGSVSPMTPPPPNDVSSSSDMTKNKTDSPAEKIQTPAKQEPQKLPVLGSEEHLISSSSLLIWSRKEFDKKQTTQPTTPPLPPTFNIFSGTASQAAKQHVSLYDGLYGSDLKTPVLPSPAKQVTKPSYDDKKTNDDDKTPYSPSSDGYDFEPPPAIDNQDKDLGSGSSYTFSSTEDGQPKSGTLKLTESTLKTFNSTMRSTGPVGLKYVNKTELSIFENYLPTSQQKSPLVKRQPGSSFLRSKMSRFANSMNENGSPAMARSSHNYHESLKPPVIEDSILDDDVPNSAVDLINKDRFLKKSLRIERVAEEVKLVLKPHYNKKNVTKEEYKEILRKAVPKICHNKTGEINIQKIHALVEAYIKKVRYKRKSGNAAISL